MTLQDVDVAAGGPGGPCTPEPLIGAITSFLATQKFPRDEVRAWLEQEIRHEGSGALSSLRDRLLSSGKDWSYFPPDPLARRIHHLLAGRLLDEPPQLLGREHLGRVGHAPLVMFANHLSYADANIVEVMLHQSGATDLADRLTVIAGPKVYSNLRRRFSSLCFGTIKVPQSSSVSSEDAVMNARDVATLARRVIGIAHDRLAAGDALLVFAEGTRSRTGTMQPLLQGAVRYLDDQPTWVMPVAISGSEALFPIGEDGLHPGPIVMSLGRPIPAETLRTRAHGNRKVMADAIGVAIADLLPAPYRGVYGDDAPGVVELRQLMRE